MLNEKERKKFEIIEKVINNEMTRKEASIELNISLRQIDRLKQLYKNEGIEGFVHGNRNKKNPNKKNDDMINEIEKLYLDEYYDYNLKHFYQEAIFGKYDISYDVMLKRFIDDDIISPLAHKKTLKEYKEKMESVINNNVKNQKENKNDKIELYKSRIIETEKAHTRRSSNLYVFGQEVQMDACEKYWFDGIVSYLHLAVDKATKKSVVWLV